MTALPTSSHVLRILQAHAENAAFDAAHAEPGPAGPLGARYDLWQSCVDLVDLLETDEDFARAFADAVMRRAAAKAGELHPEAEPPALVRHEALAELLLDGDPDYPDAAEKTAHSMSVAAELQCRTADLSIVHWDIDESSVEALIDASGAAQARATLNVLCDLFGLAYAELPHNSTHHRLMAKGDVDGIKVCFWKLIGNAEMTENAETDTSPVPRQADPGTSDLFAKAFAIAVELQHRTAPLACWWTVHEDSVKTMLRGRDPEGSRAALTVIAERFGLSYTETLHPHSGESAVKLAAAGTVDGCRVEFWNICDDPATAAALAAPAPEDAP